jgi:hypothetical protein
MVHAAMVSTFVVNAERLMRKRVSLLWVGNYAELRAEFVYKYFAISVCGTD